MIKVETLIKILNSLPSGCMCYAYEGEIIGLVIVDKDGKEFGWIETVFDDGELKKI